MITEDYVSFEVAKLLKEKGFNEECRAVRSPSRKLFYSSHDIKNFEDRKTIGGAIAAPTHQMTMKWLRKVYDIDISIIPLRSHKEYLPRVESDTISYDAIPCKEYEDACETAIKYCLKNLI